MAERKTLEEQLASLQEKKNKINEEERRLKAKISEQKRKERTKHLIETGGIIYSILGREYKDGDNERLAAFLKSQENRGEFFSKAMNGEPERIKAASPERHLHQMNRSHFNNVDDVLDDISKNKK